MSAVSHTNLQSNTASVSVYVTRRVDPVVDPAAFRVVDAQIDFWSEQYAKLSLRASEAWAAYDEALDRGEVSRDEIKRLADAAERLDKSARKAGGKWNAAKDEALKLKAGG